MVGSVVQERKAATNRVVPIWLVVADHIDPLGPLGLSTPQLFGVLPHYLGGEGVYQGVPTWVKCPVSVEKPRPRPYLQSLPSLYQRLTMEDTLASEE